MSNAIRTKYIKAIIEKTQKNRKYKIFEERGKRERNGAVKHVITECDKLMKEYIKNTSGLGECSLGKCYKPQSYRQMVYIQTCICPKQVGFRHRIDPPF